MQSTIIAKVCGEDANVGFAGKKSELLALYSAIIDAGIKQFGQEARMICAFAALDKEGIPND